MRVLRAAALSLLAGSTAVGLIAAFHEVVEARQRPVVVLRFLLGYYDRRSRFIPTAGRDATEVDRNALLMFVMSGAVDMGPKLKATLPLTLAEQSELESDEAFEPGVIQRKLAPDRESRRLAAGSITPQSVVVASSTGDLAEGVFFRVPHPRKRRYFKNRFVFNPRFRQATFGNPTEIDYNPEAMEANTPFGVFLGGGANPPNPFNLVTNLSGVPLGAEFFATFATGDTYIQDFTRPEIRETSPVDLASNVASDADIDITFSEPMDIDSFRLPRFQTDSDWSIQVSYTNNPVNGPLAGRVILGSMRVKPQTAGNVVQFRPSQGFGQGPYEISLIITAGVTDLSGNNITRQQQIIFTTEFNPDAENFGVFEETFDNNFAEDTTLVPSGDNNRAVWPADGGNGKLTTSVTNKTFDAASPNGSNSNANIWLGVQARFQMLFPPSDMGGRARTLVGMNWYRVTAVNQTYPGTTIQLGHANSVIGTAGFPTANPPGPVAANFGDTPVVVVPGTSYTTTGAGGLVTGPSWGRNFNFNGSDSVIMDIQHGGHGATTDERWQMDNNYSVQSLTFALSGNPAPAPSTRNWYFQTQFVFLSPGAEAQSLWYDIGLSNARYQPQITVPVQQPPGTQVTFLWQGAKPDVNNPTQLDASTITDWVTDIRQLANNQFLRFRIGLLNNVGTKTSPELDTLTVPYTFR